MQPTTEPFDAYEENRDSEEEMLARLKNCVKNISPELTESLDHLIQNNLYDAEESQTKLPGSAFTQEIYSYNDAFIFISPNHTAADYITLIHEFGHYNRAYYTASGDPFSPKGTDDIEEICLRDSSCCVMIIIRIIMRNTDPLSPCRQFFRR